MTENTDHWLELHNAKHKLESAQIELNETKEKYQNRLIAETVGEILAEDSSLSRRELTLILEGLVNKINRL